MGFDIGSGHLGLILAMLAKQVNEELLFLVFNIIYTYCNDFTE